MLTGSKLSKVGLYCKYCEDTYWNMKDVTSIREHKTCIICRKEGLNKPKKSVDYKRHQIREW